MSVIQVSKIQMRRGPEVDLPGAPTSLSPLVFEDGLDVGEFGYAIDTGRLFIGHDPAIGSPNYDRTEFPYRNIEILTENSENVIRRFQDRYTQEVGTGGFMWANLRLSPVGEWYDVAVETPEGAIPYVTLGDTLIATVSLFIFDTDKVPQRQSMLQVLSVPNSDEALVQVSTLTILPPIDAETDAVEFRFTRGGTPSDPNFRFQFRNLTSSELLLYFNIQRPAP